MHWTDEYLAMVADCERKPEALNDWEKGFVESMRSRLERNKIPTPTQIEILERLWLSVTQA